MRIIALAAIVAALGVAAAGSSPQQVVYARVSPNAGGLGLFIAGADGSGERPLLGAPDIDYDAVVVARRRVDRVHVGARRLRRSVSREAGRQRRSNGSPTIPAYDDQAAFSPDGKQLVFVSTRSGGIARPVDDGSRRRGARRR